MLAEKPQKNFNYLNDWKFFSYLNNWCFSVFLSFIAFLLSFLLHFFFGFFTHFISIWLDIAPIPNIGLINSKTTLLHLLMFTLWKVSKCRVFSGPCFLVFGLNTEIYSVNLRIQSEYRKVRTRGDSVFGHFSRSDCI